MAVAACTELHGPLLGNRYAIMNGGHVDCTSVLGSDLGVSGIPATLSKKAHAVQLRNFVNKISRWMNNEIQNDKQIRE